MQPTSHSSNDGAPTSKACHTCTGPRCVATPPAAPEPQMDKTQKIEKCNNAEHTSSAQCQRQTSAVKTPDGLSQKCVSVIKDKNLAQPATSMYVTRCGRVSKPNARYFS